MWYSHELYEESQVTLGTNEFSVSFESGDIYLSWICYRDFLDYFSVITLINI